MFNFIQKIRDVNPWKTKAKERRLENKNLKKEIKRLKNSRDQWKKKAAQLEIQNTELDDALKKI